MGIPFTVIGGFLGAGKTTLLNRVLSQADGTRYAVLVNDFGALNIDAELVASHGGETIALANGCICCTIGDSLIDSLVDLMSRPDPADHILVEASGVSNPARIADVAVIDPALSLDGVVVLVDAEQIAGQLDDRLVGDTIRQQIGAADLIVLNKTDLASDEQLDAARNLLSQLAPETPLVEASGADVPPDLLFGGDIRPGVPTAAAHHHHHADDHAGFSHALVTDSAPVDRATFEAALAGLPRSVYRAKGMVRFADAPQQSHIFHRVGARWTLSKPSAVRGGEPSLRLVFIGAADMPDTGALHDALYGRGPGCGERT